MQFKKLFIGIIAMLAMTLVGAPAPAFAQDADPDDTWSETDNEPESPSCNVNPPYECTGSDEPDAEDVSPRLYFSGQANADERPILEFWLAEEATIRVRAHGYAASRDTKMLIGVTERSPNAGWFTRYITPQFDGESNRQTWDGEIEVTLMPGLHEVSVWTDGSIGWNVSMFTDAAIGRPTVERSWWVEMDCGAAGTEVQEFDFYLNAPQHVIVQSYSGLETLPDGSLANQTISLLDHERNVIGTMDMSDAGNDSPGGTFSRLIGTGTYTIRVEGSGGHTSADLMLFARAGTVEDPIRPGSALPPHRHHGG